MPPPAFCRLSRGNDEALTQESVRVIPLTTPAKMQEHTDSGEDWKHLDAYMSPGSRVCLIPAGGESGAFYRFQQV